MAGEHRGVVVGAYTDAKGVTRYRAKIEIPGKPGTDTTLDLRREEIRREGLGDYLFNRPGMIGDWPASHWYTVMGGAAVLLLSWVGGWVVPAIAIGVASFVLLSQVSKYRTP